MKRRMEETRWDSVKIWILEHRKITTLTLVLFGILGMIVPGCLITSEADSRLEIIYYMSQFVSFVFVISGVIIAAWQYYVTSSAELSKLAIEQVQKAIDLSEFYKEKILKAHLVVRYVYEKSGILEILRGIKKEDMKVFDTFEMTALLSEKNIAELKALQYQEKFVKAVLEANVIYGLDLHILQRNISVLEDGQEDVVLQIEMTSLMHSFLSGVVTNMLNDLEFFAMHFTHKTADETVVFQSLHQTYIEIVGDLYYNIARCNQPTEGKYYTNVIELYEKWFERSEKQKQDTLQNVRHKTSKGTTIEKSH